MQELVWGTLRNRAWLDVLLADRVSGGLARLDYDVIDLLRLGTYQLLRMGSVPPYAAIGQTVELTATRERCATLLKTGAFPYPSDDWPAIPWPAF